MCFSFRVYYSLLVYFFTPGKILNTPKLYWFVRVSASKIQLLFRIVSRDTTP